MSISGIGSNAYEQSQRLLQKLKGESGASSSAHSEQTTDWKSRVKNDIASLLADVPKGKDGKLSFKDVDNYRKSLEKKWDIAVKADLKKLGVNPDADYPLKWDAAAGTVTTQNGHPDKAVIDKYFKDHPNRVSEFKKIIQLGKLTNMSNRTVPPKDLMRKIQEQSIAWWYEDNTDPTSWFNGGRSLLTGSRTLFSGLNRMV